MKRKSFFDESAACEHPIPITDSIEIYPLRQTGNVNVIRQCFTDHRLTRKVGNDDTPIGNMAVCKVQQVFGRIRINTDDGGSHVYILYTHIGYGDRVGIAHATIIISDLHKVATVLGNCVSLVSGSIYRISVPIPLVGAVVDLWAERETALAEVWVQKGGGINMYIAAIIG